MPIFNIFKKRKKVEEKKREPEEKKDLKAEKKPAVAKVSQMNHSIIRSYFVDLWGWIYNLFLRAGYKQQGT